LAEQGEFRWDGKANNLSDAYINPPPAGHLRIVGNTLAISGYVQGLSSPHHPNYWDVATGLAVDVPDISTTIAIAQWEMGVTQGDDTFHVIATFPP
jgi:hypothetical protein